MGRLYTIILRLSFMMEKDAIALMGGKILLCRGSARKIGGTAGKSS
ncbi:hypothetical protein [Flavobacterium sp. CLA17]|nr:hypothetical protein [Flavobacterium sp. CLA17]QSB25829.1 hypothetical protein HAV12_015780 [Flavobacterium sp. CLA17]